MTNSLQRYIYISILLIPILSFCGCHTKGVLVTIKNNSESDIQNLKIYYKGGYIEQDLIANRQSLSKYVNPVSESDLRIEFIDKDGKIRQKNFDIYIEKNYSGEIEITINSDYNFTIKDNVHI